MRAVTKYQDDQGELHDTAQEALTADAVEALSVLLDPGLAEGGRARYFAAALVRDRESATAAIAALELFVSGLP